MTIEQKAKAYDEAIEGAKKQRADYQKELDKTDKNSQLAGILGAGIGAIELVFPELRESEDERIRKWIKKEIEDKYVVEGIVNNKLADEAFGWLEKQKHLYETTKDRFYREGFEEGQLYEKQKEQKVTSFNEPYNPDDYEVVIEGDATILRRKEQKSSIVEKLREISTPADEDWFEIEKKWEKEDEQKPAEYLDNDKVYAIMKKLHDLSFSKRIPINSEEFKQIGEITKDVRELLDYPIEQKPAEWSDEDEHCIELLDTIIDSSALISKNRIKCHSFLKSLRPSWKPSEEHFQGLRRAITKAEKGSDAWNSLTDLYEQLKKL